MGPGLPEPGGPARGLCPQGRGLWGGRGGGVWRQLGRVCSRSGWSRLLMDPAFLRVVNNSHLTSVCETSLRFTFLSSY